MVYRITIGINNKMKINVSFLLTEHHLLSCKNLFPKTHDRIQVFHFGYIQLR